MSHPEVLTQILRYVARYTVRGCTNIDLLGR